MKCTYSHTTCPKECIHINYSPSLEGIQIQRSNFSIPKWFKKKIQIKFSSPEQSFHFSKEGFKLKELWRDCEFELNPVRTDTACNNAQYFSKCVAQLLAHSNSCNKARDGTTCLDNYFQEMTFLEAISYIKWSSRYMRLLMSISYWLVKFWGQDASLKTWSRLLDLKMT